MIVYMCKRTNGNLTMKRWVQLRKSDKNKRVYAEMDKLRKRWWHFKTRWTA